MPVFRGSTGQVQGLYPWLYGASMPPAGAYIGVDCLAGGAFAAHPVEWLRRGPDRQPEPPGHRGTRRGQVRHDQGPGAAADGLRGAVFRAGDIKNEYAPLARALGVEPVELGPGLHARLNPLDAGPLGDQPARRSRTACASGSRRSTAAA